MVDNIVLDIFRVGIVQAANAPERLAARRAGVGDDVAVKVQHVAHSPSSRSVALNPIRAGSALAGGDRSRRGEGWRSP